MSQLYYDLDGVLGDTLGFARKLFGGLWDFENNFKALIPKINEYGTFYLDQPLMSGALEMWNLTKDLDPIVLTGIHSDIPNMAQQKMEWVNRHFGSHVRVICCKSTDKYLHGKPLDILVDDRIKYSQSWIAMGGIFIHHQSVAQSLAALGAALGTLGRFGY